MTRLIAAAALLFLAAPLATMAEARESSPAQQAQQQRMRSCNADARTRDLRGDPRKAFMRDCLRRRPAGAAPPPN